MQVCMDYQPAVAQTAGVGRYTRLLAEHLAATATPEDALELFYFDFSRRAGYELPQGAQSKPCRWLTAPSTRRLRTTPACERA